MRYLLDTHTVIWMARGDKRISSSLIDTIKDAETVFVSAMSGWEYGILRNRNRLEWPEPFSALMAALPAEPLDFKFEATALSETLPAIHGDPFDRMLVAQAILDDLVLVTRDKIIQSYPVKTLW